MPSLLGATNGGYDVGRRRWQRRSEFCVTMGRVTWTDGIGYSIPAVWNIHFPITHAAHSPSPKDSSGVVQNPSSSSRPTTSEKLGLREHQTELN